MIVISAIGVVSTLVSSFALYCATILYAINDIFSFSFVLLFLFSIGSGDGADCSCFVLRHRLPLVVFLFFIFGLGRFSGLVGVGLVLSFVGKNEGDKIIVYKSTV